jgi:hypothetical protein
VRTSLRSERATAGVELARRLQLAGTPPLEGRWGVEHEYSIMRGATAIAFSDVIDRLRVEGRRLDPSDPNARRLLWGGVLTADGREAEVVTPPVAIAPGGSERTVRFARQGRTELACALGAYDDQLRAVGYSTHLNVSAPDRLTMPAGRLLVRHFSPALMLLIDREHSPGLLIRPRRHRLEIAGEYLEGRQLGAALTFTAGAVRATTRAARSVRARNRLPSAVRPHVRQADQRFGWYVDRRAFGPDLYREGRDAVVRSGRRTRRAADLLHESWTHIRDDTATIATAMDVALLDDMVDGHRPLPIEGPADDIVAGRAESVHGSVIRTTRRKAFDVEARVATWDATLFCVRTLDRDAQCVVNIPDAHLDAFIRLLAAGELDDLLVRALRARPSGRVLRLAAQTGNPAIFDEVSDAGAFAPTERDVETGRIGGGGTGSREHKHHQGGQPRPRRWFRKPQFVVAAAAAVAVAAVAAVAVTGGGSRSHAATSPTLTTSARPIAPQTVASQLTGSYSIANGALTTTYRRGLLAGTSAIVDANEVTYVPIDSVVPTRLPTYSGTVTMSCSGDTCHVSPDSSGPLYGVTMTVSGDRGVVVDAPHIALLAQCNAPVPPGTLGSTGPATVTVLHGDSADPNRVTGLRYATAYIFDRETSPNANDNCANVIVASLEVVLTKIT